MIKKFLFIHLLIFFTSTFLFAQRDTIANGGFENWHTTPYNEPDNWFTLNTLLDIGFPESTIKTPEAHSGQFAALLETMSNSFNNIPGILSSGIILNAGSNPDFSKNKIAFKSRPVKWRFYFKAAPISGDTCFANMVLTKWDSVFRKVDTVAISSFQQSDTINSYSLAEINFTYFSKAFPDSASILFSSSNNMYSPIAGSVFYVDDISLVYDNTGINNAFQEPFNLTVYPNPFIKCCSINFDSHENESLNIAVFDLYGLLILEKKIHTVNGKNTSELKEFSSFPNGLYFLKATMNNHSQVFKVLKCTE